MKEKTKLNCGLKKEYNKVIYKKKSEASFEMKSNALLFDQAISNKD